jgi:hypothetical protein
MVDHSLNDLPIAQAQGSGLFSVDDGPTPFEMDGLQALPRPDRVQRLNHG